MKKPFVSNSTESSRMFKSDFLERFSVVHYSVPLIVFIPVILYFIYSALFVWHNSILTFVACGLGGLLFWTLTEYVMHRFIFHFVPKSKWGQRLHFIFHGVHHDYPNDALRLVLPPSVSIPLATGFYFVFRAVLPPDWVSASFALFIAGYLFYDISHYALHHATFKSPFWKKLKHHHMQHHYSDATKGYGVSSALWDKIFRSDFEK
ncbi:Fatty acid hydroxylase superfamily protein [Chryseolinea serpens]|uniref:Fatty acid hydroxylase superfamily protein n=1 Tax=Chryseolinea serpens TaxID=947013 RepID=A0A1M5UU41_9BACT|nr:sterol desaturase family protein [Chryseolinea serpens]SHH66454.1 Fatty acid hydroxylase superfamily protein [Chryseolinea serpens]